MRGGGGGPIGAVRHRSAVDGGEAEGFPRQDPGRAGLDPEYFPPAEEDEFSGPPSFGPRSTRVSKAVQRAAVA